MPSFENGSLILTSDRSNRGASDSIGFLSAPPSGGPSISVWSWAGRRVGRIKVRHDVQCCAGTPQLSPNGRFVLIPYTNGESGVVINLAGRVVIRLPYTNGIWASDSDHICAFKPLKSTGQPLTQYARVAVESLQGEVHSKGRVQTESDHYGASIAECDPRDSQAVIFGNFMGDTSLVSYLNLSTGGTHSPKWAPMGAAGFSGNDQYIAFHDGEIRNARTGALVANVGSEIEAISWQGHVVMKLAGCRSEALDWVTHRILWISTGPVNPPCEIQNVVVAAEPHSDTLALNVGNVPQDDSGATLWVVRPQSTPKRVARDVQLGLV
jgi:hypothetical protein